MGSLWDTVKNVGGDVWNAAANVSTYGLYGAAKAAAKGDAGGAAKDFALGGYGTAAGDLSTAAQDAGIGGNPAANNYRGGMYQQNPNDYNYGGSPEGAGIQSSIYGDLANQARNRRGPAVDQSLSANDWGNQQADRRGQGDLLQQYQDIANGRNSVVGAQMQHGLDQNIASQMALANSSRGGGIGYAAAQGQALENASAMGQAQAAQGAMLGAQERQNALGAMGGIYGQMQQGDLASRGMSNQMALGMAGLEAGQRQLNDQTGLGYSQLQAGVNNAQLQGSISRDTNAGNNYNSANAVNAGISQANSAANGQVIGGALNAVGGVGGAILGGMYGGPAGAAVGGAVGGKLGSVIGPSSPAPAPALSAPAPAPAGSMNPNVNLTTQDYQKRPWDQ